MKAKFINNIVAAAFLAWNAVAALAAEHYVNPNNPAPSAPYLTWATAATNIQIAIDVAAYYDVITVTNGIYQTGTSNLSRVAITRPLVVRSVNGPGVTIIDGGGAVRCVWVEGGSVLSGFTLTNGNTGGSGGGALAVDGYNGVVTLTNCLITGNAAAGFGGGADLCNLNNCVVSNNYAAQTGGGVSGGLLNNCTFVNNVARFGGGGAAPLAMTNCTLIGNSATNGSGGGAIPFQSTPSPISFLNCAFINNRASNFGGGFFYYNIYNAAARLYSCTFTNNSATAGGGAYGGSLVDCVLAGNQATNGVGAGGGATYSGLGHCLVVGNSAKKGGGVFGGYIDDYTVGTEGTAHCVIASNSASIAGGGIYGYGTHQFAIITNNLAHDGGGFASDDFGNPYYFYDTEFNNCQFSANWATNRGGAVYQYCSLFSCTIAGNSAGNQGGGVCGTSDSYPSVSDSVIYLNSAPVDPNCDTNSSVVNCCAIPMPANGYNNITNNPAFMNMAAGNFRLSSNSPCINFAYYPYPSDPSYVDLDGNPRVVGSGRDIGAYEFQNPVSILAYYWLQQYGLPTDGSADHTDPDGDHFDNWSEWRAGTSPLNAASFLRFSRISVVTNGVDPTPLIHLEWQAVPNVTYFLEASSSVTGPFTNFVNYIPADSTNMIWEGAIDPTEQSKFYKVGVQ